LKLKCTLQNLLEKRKLLQQKLHPQSPNEETLKNKTNKYTMSLVHQLPFWSQKTGHNPVTQKINLRRKKDLSFRFLSLWTEFGKICMHVCMYVYMNVCMYVCMHVCMYVLFCFVLFLLFLLGYNLNISVFFSLNFWVKITSFETCFWIFFKN
jgi:hypothetical protein